MKQHWHDERAGGAFPSWLFRLFYVSLPLPPAKNEKEKLKKTSM